MSYNKQGLSVTLHCSWGKVKWEIQVPPKLKQTCVEVNKIVLFSTEAVQIVQQAAD